MSSSLKVRFPLVSGFPSKALRHTGVEDSDSADLRNGRSIVPIDQPLEGIAQTP